MKLSVRQICFIMLAYTAASKILMYPTYLSITCKNDLLFPAIIDFLICGIVIWAVSFLCSKTDKTFYQLLQNSIGTVGARIFYGFFAVYFLLASLLPIFEQKLYVHNIFYDTVPSLGVFLPFFALSAYACSKRFTNIGRCADICMPLFIGTMVFMFAMAFSEVEWNNLLPVLKTPASELFKGTAGSFFNFTEPCWMLMFMGHFKYKKGDSAKITLSFAGGAVIVLLFLATFMGVYGPIAPSRTFAIARTSLFFPAIETIGRIDLILLFIIEIVMLFAMMINIQFAVHAISKCIGCENLKVISFAVNLALLIIVVFANNFYSDIHDLYFNWMWIVFVVFGVAVPLLAWTLKRRREER
ncbi:MAG: GerAB/ArcD/ProY family transporter [Clostridia bacterium]|nr:GerAB/ArcD/ProY family transporter [Clostridia bacterium]